MTTSMFMHRRAWGERPFAADRASAYVSTYGGAVAGAWDSDHQASISTSLTRASSIVRCIARSTMRSSSGRNGLVGSWIPRTGPRASIAGFQSADQLRDDDTPNRMHSVTAPAGSGELETAWQASLRWSYLPRSLLMWPSPLSQHHQESVTGLVSHLAV